MNSSNSIKVHDDGAKIYDDQVREYQSHMHEILFGMLYENIKQGETLLDIGIGTGLSSIYFAQNGLLVYGMDASKEMLKECRRKKFTEDLKEHSITDIPFPYKNEIFHNVICCGVFHFIGEISSITKEISRIVKVGGLYAFTVMTGLANDIGSNNYTRFTKVSGNWGIPIYKHSDEYIYKILKTNSFIIEKEQQILAHSGNEEIGDIVFKIYIVKKSKEE